MAYGLRRWNEQVIEVCNQCGFDTRLVPDLVAAMRSAFDAMANLQLRPQAGQRPKQDVWSAVEYAERVIGGSRRAVALVRAAVGLPLPDAVSDLESAKAITIVCVESMSTADQTVPCPLRRCAN